MNEFLSHFIHEFQFPLSNPVLIFALILSIILFSPLLLKKLNIPGIIGLIISGLIVGPNGLNILAKNSAVDLFSTIGLLYIMFIAGLDLDLNQFKTNKYKSILFGFFTFTLPISIGFPVCYYLLGYDLNASLLTSSMFATHTLVAYPIVSKLGVTKNQAVAITVGGTILTDTAVLIILAIILNNSHGTLDQAFWIRLAISLTIFSFIMFYIIPKVTKWFFKKLESEKHSHYIFVLAVVFFAAFLAQLSGLEPIIGAFVAGLALNKHIPHSSALMNRIEFIGNSLFIPFFLISVGMIVDVSVLLKGPMALIVAVTLTIVALIGKWVAAFFTQLIFKFSNAQRQLIFGLSSSHAAATLAIILVGYNQKILDENILNGTIILILITCIVASFATEKAAKIIAITDSSDIAHSAVSELLHSEHILLPIANMSSIEKLLEFSLLIKDKKSANPISILSVVPNNEEADNNIVKSKNKLEEYVKQASATEIKVNVIATIDQNVASGISRISREILSDIIVMGWPQNSGMLDKLIGDKVDSIISNVDRCLFISYLDKPCVYHKRIIIIAPPLIELEKGFEVWISKIAKLSNELNILIFIFGAQKTFDTIVKFFKNANINTELTHKQFIEWDDFLILSRYIFEDDLLVLISSRKGYVSYFSNLENIPYKLERFFERNNKIIIYPQQFEEANRNVVYDNISSAVLSKGIEKIGSILINKKVEK